MPVPTPRGDTSAPTTVSAAVGITISMATSTTAMLALTTPVGPVDISCSQHPGSPSPMTSAMASPLALHHTPIRSRDIGEDMEQIRLSRQDNPYLQRVAGSQASLVDEEIMNMCALDDHADTTYLVSQTDLNQDALSLSEVHEHLIRSPPPTSVPKTLTGKTLFVFDTDILNDSHKFPTLPSLKSSLNPLLCKRTDDVLDQQIRQILENQKKLSIPKDCAMVSCSVPGSPARCPTRTQSYRRSSHQRNFPENTAAGEHGPTTLAPVQPNRKKHSVTDEVFLNRPLLSSAPRLGTAIDRHFKRSSSLRATVSSSNPVGSSSSLTLPIRCPHQPATSQLA